MKPSEVKKALMGALSADIPAFIWGQPGVGKSDTINDAAAEMGLPLIDLRAAQLDPVDVRGIPSVENGRTKWNVPGFLPEGGMGLLFLDELPAASMAVQSSLLQLVLDRAVGDYKLPEGWRIVAAGNRSKDGAGIGKFNAALADRFLHLDFEPDIHDWIDWAGAFGIDPRIVAFIQTFPKHLNDWDAKRRINATPRSWGFIDRAIKNTDLDTFQTMAPGIVGDGIAAELSSFLRMTEALATYAQIVADPEGVEIPERLDVRYALINAVAHQAKAKDAKSVMIFIGRMPADFQRAALQLLHARQSPVCETPAYSVFVSSSQK